MQELSVVGCRGTVVETNHLVSLAVVDRSGAMVAQAGDPEQVTYWRSAAKPFQVMPLVEDGGVEHFHLEPAMLALACGSHNAEPVHREMATRWLSTIGLAEGDLACGGHRSLWPALADEMVRDGVVPTPIWSNCSGKHAALLAMARLHQWKTAGYQELAHPVQQRIAATVASWSGLAPDQLAWGIDGCTAAAVALPVSAMARAYARLGTSDASAATAIRNAMTGHPYLVAGADRLDTVLMREWPQRVVVKVGADGVYSAALPTLGLGLALKVHDGDGTSAAVALLHVLGEITRRLDASASWPMDAMEEWRAPLLRNTRDVVVGRIEPRGAVRWA